MILLFIILFFIAFFLLSQKTSKTKTTTNTTILDYSENMEMDAPFNNLNDINQERLYIEALNKRTSEKITQCEQQIEKCLSIVNSFVSQNKQKISNLEIGFDVLSSENMKFKENILEKIDTLKKANLNKKELSYNDEFFKKIFSSLNYLIDKKLFSFETYSFTIGYFDFENSILDEKHSILRDLTSSCDIGLLHNISIDEKRWTKSKLNISDIDEFKPVKKKRGHHLILELQSRYSSERTKLVSSYGLYINPSFNVSFDEDKIVSFSRKNLNKDLHAFLISGKLYDNISLLFISFSSAMYSPFSMGSNNSSSITSCDEKNSLFLIESIFNYIETNYNNSGEQEIIMFGDFGLSCDTFKNEYFSNWSKKNLFCEFSQIFKTPTFQRYDNVFSHNIHILTSLPLINFQIKPIYNNKSEIVVKINPFFKDKRTKDREKFLFDLPETEMPYRGGLSVKTQNKVE